ncbi:hypothetical protein ACFRMQ_09410 [Kitasatospora sp. NPDC056783]|uniref:hypothetical protein n=1 Tax=Kitasatospora sp. NPDC056783 TaxID=3345943 RepID=UPI0036A5BC2D
MPKLVRKVVVLTAVVAAALVGVSTASGSVESQSGAKPETVQALQTLTDDLNWG